MIQYLEPLEYVHMICPECGKIVALQGTSPPALPVPIRKQCDKCKVWMRTLSPVTDTRPAIPGFIMKYWRHCFIVAFLLGCAAAFALGTILGILS